MNAPISVASDDPDNPCAVRTWVASNHSERDLFKRIAQQSAEHRAVHHCNAYPCDDGLTLGFLAAALGANRILEIGTGLGYSALWLAHGCRPGGTVTTIERDPVHARIARENILNEGYAESIFVQEGDALSILAELPKGFDLIVVDADIVDYASYLRHIERLLRPRGLLLTSNLFYGQYDRSTGCLHTAGEIRQILLDGSKWITAFLQNGDCLSVLK
jgi:predicted O-methyltransferase YrrM